MSYTQTSHNLLSEYAEALSRITLPSNFDDIIKKLSGIKGKIIVTGLGKSGLIAQKLVATLSSTGSPSCFLHAAEAGHGDLGMLQSCDALIALSHSGESKECQYTINHAKTLGAPIVTITQSSHSTMGKNSKMSITYPFNKEYGPHALAPSTSTTVMLALCDCLALSLAEYKKMSPELFAINHPSGSLGLQLMPVNQIMHPLSDCPIITISTTIRQAIHAMTTHSSGLALVCAGQKIKAVFSDGDLRRTMLSDASLNDPVIEHATNDFVSLTPEDSTAKAKQIMQETHITAIPVAADGFLKGCIDIHQIRMQSK